MKGKAVMWQFAISSGLPYLYGKIGDYVILYGDKDKNTMQGNLASGKKIEKNIFITEKDSSFPKYEI